MRNRLSLIFLAKTLNHKSQKTLTFLDQFSSLYNIILLSSAILEISKPLHLDKFGKAILPTTKMHQAQNHQQTWEKCHKWVSQHRHHVLVAHDRDEDRPFQIPHHLQEIVYQRRGDVIAVLGEHQHADLIGIVLRVQPKVSVYFQTEETVEYEEHEEEQRDHAHHLGPDELGLLVGSYLSGERLEDGDIFAVGGLREEVGDLSDEN